MSKRWAIPTVGLVAVIGSCGGCLWSMFERPRFSHAFDIGGGRTLTVWSIRRDTNLFSGRFLDPNPLMVFYRVDADTREVVHTTLLGHDDGGDYEFRMVTTGDGRLACVYESPRAAGTSFVLLMFDADTGESWPRTWNDRGGTFADAVAEWRGRFRALKAENPDLPSPAEF